MEACKIELKSEIECVRQKMVEENRYQEMQQLRDMTDLDRLDL